MVITGYTQRIEQDLTPSMIIAPEYAASGDPALLAAYCLAAIDPALAERANPDDILVVDGHLADGADKEQAIFALQALGIAAVICTSTADAFADLAGSYGLPLLVQPQAATATPAGHIVRLDLERGTINDQTQAIPWNCEPCSPDVLAAVRRNVLLTRMRRVVEDEGFAE